MLEIWKNTPLWSYKIKWEQTSGSHLSNYCICVILLMCTKGNKNYQARFQRKKCNICCHNIFPVSILWQKQITSILIVYAAWFDNLIRSYETDLSINSYIRRGLRLQLVSLTNRAKDLLLVIPIEILTRFSLKIKSNKS